MIQYKNLTIIGTSHISIESIKEVQIFINQNKPNIIALELDQKRFYSLQHKTSLKLKDIFQLGIKAFLFNLIGSYIEKKLGKLVNVSPGSEMKTAIKLAKKYNLQISLIDQDITITIKRFMKFLTWKEKFRFIYDIIHGIIKRPKIQFDLTKVPSKKLIRKLMSKVKKDYPSVYKTLIHERNIIMAKNLNKLTSKHHDKTILAIIGAGHEEDVFKILKRNKGVHYNSYSSNINIRIQ
ncbi:MAG: TraB/GumN family protein [Nanoarchaeota archaeon]|nr:TraB/GumN family protein [Nanoarchaeota archaeon]